MEPFIGKKYKLKTSENFEEYLKFIGVGYISRKTAISVNPVSILTLEDDGYYSFTMITIIRSVKFRFKLGEEFEEERADGVMVKSVIVFEGNKMIQVQKESNGRRSVHVREFKEDSLIATTTADGWEGTCVRIYEALE